MIILRILTDFLGSFLFYFILFIYWLYWVFVAACGLLYLQHVVTVHGLSCPLVHGILVP